MRLLLDEPLSPVIADRLRSLGHDVEAVAHRRDLRGAPDAAILATASAEGRVLVTSDAGDFSRLATRRLATGDGHAGVILVPSRTSPPTLAAIGRLVNAMHALAVDHDPDSLRDRTHWLAPPR